jgi:hypothetical protein
MTTLWQSASDEEVIAIANVENGRGLPIFRVPLRTFSQDEPDTAEVDFRSDPPIVRRFKRVGPTP